MQQLSKNISRPRRHGGGDDGGRAQEPGLVEPREDLVARGEEVAKAEGEEVGRVARRGEDVARDAEGSVADADVGFRGEELGD